MGYTCSICKQFVADGVMHYCGGTIPAGNIPYNPPATGFTFTDWGGLYLRIALALERIAAALEKTAANEV